MKSKNQTQIVPRTLAHGVSIFGAAVMLAGLAGPLPCCAADSTGSSLRVGITPEYPPLVFRQPDGTNGVEIDLAKALGAELKRPVQFVVLNRDDLIPALVENRIDIIMSGIDLIAQVTRLLQQHPDKGAFRHATGERAPMAILSKGAQAAAVSG